ncbi:hypothetical protein MKX03_036267 [Papaver bracteatum]|nr:hypothetical protein MKX03_036267 [Papaver bracteatum]
MASSTQIQVKEEIYITPSSLTPSHILPLSSLDSQLFIRFTIEYLLIYNNPARTKSAADRNAFTSRIKAALSVVLVPYYPLAGVTFVEAVSHSISIYEFQKAPCHSTQRRNLLSIHVADLLRESPPLVVQPTWLTDSADAVGVGINHCLCDGIGSADFLNFFASLTTGQCRGFTYLKVKPVWDRHLMNPVKHPEFNRVQDLCGFMSRFTRESFTPTSVKFDQKSLNGLKKLATSTILSAHVWRCWAMSLGFPSTQTLQLIFKGFYRNRFVLGSAQISVGELADKVIGWASWLVRKAKEGVGDEYVESVVEMMSESSACPDSVGVLIVSQWSRLGLEKVEFGMGKPVHVGLVLSDRYCLFLLVNEQRDAVKVMVAVPKNASGKYEYLVKSPCSNST